MALLLGILVLLGIYLLVDIGRILARRMHRLYLRKAVLETSVWLLGLGAAAVLIAVLVRQAEASTLAWLYAAAGVQLAAALIVAVSTQRHLRTTRQSATAEDYNETELPTLSVCIPARNETGDLEDCLRSLTASTYPKLEILVLDDNSQNKRTPEIIRGFAQAGVIFLAGQPPPEHWLAKNYAYKQLAEAANGELLLFAGVDCRFEPSSLDSMAGLLLQKQKTMLSVLPRNVLPSQSLAALLVQPARYAWELALPRRLLERPPVLSTCWLIKRSSLERAGGFAAVERKIVPESYFARQTAVVDDGYSFVQADTRLGLSSAKSFTEQQATAVRTRYPQLHRRPELVALVSLAELFLLVLPLVMAVISALAGLWWLAGLSGSAYLIQGLVYAKIVNLTYRRFIPAGLLVFPIAAIYDIGLLNYSMWQYEFGAVVWKGRSLTQTFLRPGSARTG